MTSSQACLTRSQFLHSMREPAGTPVVVVVLLLGCGACPPASRAGLQQLRAQVSQEHGTGSHHTHVQPLSTHSAGHTQSHDRGSTAAPVCHHHPSIPLTCPRSATTAQGGSTVSVAMPGMFWQDVFPESCTFEKALKKPRPLCLNSD